VRPIENVYDELGLLLEDAGEISYAPGYGASGVLEPALVADAQQLAQLADVAVVVVGLPDVYEEEGADRTHLDLPPGHNALVEAVLAVQPNTVVVLVNGSAVSMPWADRVPAIVECWLGGQSSGGAIADVLTGRVNPSGKLAETFPVRLEDTPAYLTFPDDGTGHVPFTEGLFTGYRWYDARHLEPLFPFGHGLSYTTFEYGDLQLEQPSVASGGTLKFSVRVRNTGTRAGQEVVQIYVGEQQPSLPRPDKELKAFAKVSLAAGAEATVTFELTARDFAHYDPRVSDWVVTAGAFDVLVGASSRDIRLHATVNVAASGPGRTVFSRLTPLRDWVSDPMVRASVWPMVGGLLQFFGQAALAAQIEAGEVPLNDFFGDAPISKLAMFGVISEDELTELIASANGGL
jgi:beta-glucosidase